MPIVRFVGIGQSGAGNPTTDAHVVKLVRRRPQTGFDISQALAVGELCESHTKELVPAGKSSWSVIATVAFHAATKLAIWKIGNKLRKHGSSKIHEPLLTPVQAPPNFKSRQAKTAPNALFHNMFRLVLQSLAGQQCREINSSKIRSSSRASTDAYIIDRLPAPVTISSRCVP